MKADLTQLLMFFDELTPVSDEEQGVYWFESRIRDGLIVTFAFSIYESYVNVIIQTSSKTDITGLRMENCSEIRVLDESRKCLEVVHENGKGRCFLSLLQGTILSYRE